MATVVMLCRGCGHIIPVTNETHYCPGGMIVKGRP